MTVERLGRQVVLECDTIGCAAEFEMESGEPFAEGFARAKRAGWTARKIGKDFVHACPRHTV